MGSKNRIAKYILPIILKDRKEGQYYVEPFVGGCNMIDKVDGNRIGNDNNKYLIAMWQGLISGINYPTHIPKDLYNVARDVYNGTELRFEHQMNMTDDMVGWIGWMGSYNGRFFDGGYSGHNVGITNRNYISEQIKNTQSQIQNLKGIQFFSLDYSELEITCNSIIYSDIPYKNSKQYSTSKNFDHDKFWQWCREKSLEGHSVFISEYEAPNDFECIWSKEIKNTLNQTKTYTPTEKLFRYNG